MVEEEWQHRSCGPANAAADTASDVSATLGITPNFLYGFLQRETPDERPGVVCAAVC